MIKDGINPDKFKVYVNITPVSTTDPEIIFVEYEQTASPISYIPPVVKIEVSGRSMSEPVENVLIESLIDEAVPGGVVRGTQIHSQGCDGEANISRKDLSFA